MSISEFDFINFTIINKSLRSMLFILAKILISIHLCFLAYHNVFHQITSESIKSLMSANIATLNLHERNTEFLNLYLNKMIAFCLFTSVIMIISKNILPKFMTILGIVLWMYFGYHQQISISIKIKQYAEHLAILGGIMYMAGSEYFESVITLQDFKNTMQKANDPKQEDNQDKQKVQ